MLEDGYESAQYEPDPGDHLEHPQVVLPIFSQATVSKFDYDVSAKIAIKTRFSIIFLL